MSIKTAVITILPPVLRKYTAKIEASPLGYRLAKGAFWSLTGALISRGLGLISSILVARMLGKEGFGELGIIQSTVGMFGVFAGFGMGITATKYIAEFKIKDPAKAGRIMSLSGLVAIITGGIISIALVVFAPWLAKNTLAAPHLSKYLQISAGLLFLNALNGAQNGALSGFEAFKSTAYINFWAGLTSFPLMVGGVYIAGLEGAMWGLVASMGINCLLTDIALRNEVRKANVPFSLHGCIKEWKLLLCFTLPSLLSGGVTVQASWICNAMLVNQPNGYIEMGVYTAANQWFGMLLFLPSLLSNVTLPILSEFLGEKDKIQSEKMLLYSIKLNAFIVTPITIVCCLFSPYIMYLYNESYKSEWIVLIIVLISAELFSIQKPFSDFLIASGNIWSAYSTNNLIWSIAYVLISINFVEYGSIGLSVARLEAYAIGVISIIWVTSMVLKNLSTTPKR